MTLNIVNKEAAPLPPYECELVSTYPAGARFVLGALWLKSQKYFWASGDDWFNGRSLLAQIGANTLMPCGNDIVNALDRLYVMLDGRLVGTIRSVSGTGTELDPYIYSPSIPQDGGDPIAQPGSLIGSLHYHSEAWENLLRGSTSDNFDDARSFRDQLQELIDQDTDDDADITSIITALTAAGVDLDALLLLLA